LFVAKEVKEMPEFYLVFFVESVLGGLACKFENIVRKERKNILVTRSVQKILSLTYLNER